jgi:excisionase family DNA binding protein
MPIIPQTSLGCMPLTVTVAETAELTRLSRKTIWDLISAKYLDTTTVGRRRLILTSSLLKLLDSGTPTTGNIKEAAQAARREAA